MTRPRQSEAEDADRRRVRQPPELLAPLQVLRRDEWMEELLEPRERLAVVEDDGRERAAVDLALRGDDAVPHALDHRVTHVRQIIDLALAEPEDYRTLSRYARSEYNTALWRNEHVIRSCRPIYPLLIPT